MSEKEQLILACDTASKFPQNLTHHGNQEHTQKAYTRRLDGQEDRLFRQDDGRLRVDMVEYVERTHRELTDERDSQGCHVFSSLSTNGTTEFEEKIIPNIAMLKQNFSDNLYDDLPDSKCTYM